MEGAGLVNWLASRLVVHTPNAPNPQVHVLASLWRLFRGRKFNPLRGRVDSAPCQLDRLMASSLLLAAVLFLLPTCATFYLVFAGLRCAVVLVQQLVTGAITAVLRWPALTAPLWLANSARIRSAARFQTLSVRVRNPASVSHYYY